MAKTMKASLVVISIFALLFSQQFASARRLNKHNSKVLSQQLSQKQASATKEDATIEKTKHNITSAALTAGKSRKRGTTLKAFFAGAMVGAGIGFTIADVAQGCGMCVVGPSTYNLAMNGTAMGNTLNFVGWAGIAHSMYEVGKHGYAISQWDNETTGCEKNVDRASLVFAFVDVGANIAGQMGTPAVGAAVGMATALAMTAWDYAAEKIKQWCTSMDNDDEGPELEPEEEEALRQSIAVTSARPMVSEAAKAQMDYVMPAPDLTPVLNSMGLASQWQVQAGHPIDRRQYGSAIRFIGQQLHQQLFHRRPSRQPNTLAVPSIASATPSVAASMTRRPSTASTASAMSATPSSAGRQVIASVSRQPSAQSGASARSGAPVVRVPSTASAQPRCLGTQCMQLHPGVEYLINGQKVMLPAGSGVHYVCHPMYA